MQASAAASVSGLPAPSSIRTSADSAVPTLDPAATPSAAAAPNAILDGYALFSDFIATDPRRTTTIFRRFDRLTVRNLLYLEHELMKLEAELDVLDNAHLSTEMVDGVRDWEILQLQADFGDDNNPDVQELAVQRRNLVLDVRSKLKEYHEALQLAQSIFKLNAPDIGDLNTNQMVLKANTERTRGFEIIKGLMASHLDDTYKTDMCSLAPAVERDWLTTRLETTAMAWVSSPNLALSNRAYKITEWCITIFSLLLVEAWIVGAIVGLYYWRDDHGRLILLSVLTLGFSLSLAILTTARRQEIFASTAAYAAVLVVFIGSALSNQSGTTTGIGADSSSPSSNATLGARDVYVTAQPVMTAQPVSNGSIDHPPSGSSDFYDGIMVMALVSVTATSIYGVWRKLRERRTTV
ncbi:hypothetical protein LTR50_001628 [Elasticomyces elasticus]|nr:hypothetical protein LTR50_001628 [Elasticomyces elasticus]